MERKKVIIIDDEQAVLNFLFVLLAQTDQYDTEILNDSSKAYEILKNNDYDLLLLDMDMPSVTGLDILQFIKSEKVDIETIVLTGVDDVELAVSAMKEGAYDYLKKPVDNDLLLLTMERALERKSMRHEIAELKKGSGWDSIKNKEAFDGIITRNSRMIEIFKFIEKIAPSNSSVLIMGESGTGKELIAKAIHKVSNRSNKPFIAVNAGVFARELFASEFFGHTRGAFSGAHQDKKGFLEEASGGTLFLDEIGELQMEVQVKLLRVLQTGEFFRVGSTKPQYADVQLIAATNKNLWEELKNGTFRKDLFYRLNVNTITLPPLRDRKEDIPLLVRHFLNLSNIRNNLKLTGVSDEVINLFNIYTFPGNIRELENLVYSATLIEQSEILTAASLSREFISMAEKNKPGNIRESATEQIISLEEVEKSHIIKVLRKTGGNRTKAAKHLGISRITLISKIKKYNIDE